MIMQIGINVMSLGTPMNQNFESCINNLKNAGCNYFELMSDWGAFPETIKFYENLSGEPSGWDFENSKKRISAIRKAGMDVKGMFVFEECLKGQADELGKYCQELHISYIVLSFLNYENGIDSVYEKINFINELAVTLNKYDVQIIIHNHEHDFNKLTDKDGVEKYILDIILEHCSDTLMLELDTGWALYAGIDIPNYIQTHLDQLAILHFKDICKQYKNTDRDNIFVPCGDGAVDFATILNAIPDDNLNRILYVLDQDKAETDIVEEQAKSLQYLHKLFDIRESRQLDLSLMLLGYTFPVFMNPDFSPKSNANITDYENILKLAHNAGFSAVDLSSGELDHFGGDTVNSLLKKYNLKVASIILAEDYTCGTSEKQATVANHTEYIITEAQKTGCKKIMLVAGATFSETEKSVLQKNMLINLKAAVEIAMKYNMQASIEEFPSILLPMCSSAEMDFLFENIPNLHMIYDSANMLAVNESPIEYHHHFANKINGYHIKDVVICKGTETWGDLIADNRKMQTVIPGDGIIDLKNLFKMANKIGYNGYLSVEYMPPFGELDVDKLKMIRERLVNIMEVN